MLTAIYCRNRVPPTCAVSSPSRFALIIYRNSLHGLPLHLLGWPGLLRTWFRMSACHDEEMCVDLDSNSQDKISIVEQFHIDRSIG